MNFLDLMIERAKKDIKTIVLPESSDIRTLTAASTIAAKGFADIILLGVEEDIRKTAGNDLDLSGVEIVDHISSKEFDEYTALYYEMRKSKGISMDDATNQIKNSLYYGAMMVYTGRAHGMVAGAINTTSNTMRPALQIIKTRKDSKIVSSFCIITLPYSEFGLNGNFLFSDVGLVENPTAEELSEIAIASASSFKALFSEEPKVAMLSYSTYGSAKSVYTEKVLNATKLAKEKAPGLLLDGELQADAAIVPHIGESKAPGSKVAGKANVLIFPDLNSGNIAVKLAERLGRGEMYGPITQGLNKPVNDLSRGCKAEDIVGTVAITAVQAQFAEEG